MPHDINREIDVSADPKVSARASKGTKTESVQSKSLGKCINNIKLWPNSAKVDPESGISFYLCVCVHKEKIEISDLHESPSDNELVNALTVVYEYNTYSMLLTRPYTVHSCFNGLLVQRTLPLNGQIWMSRPQYCTI